MPGGTKAAASVEAYGARERNELRANVFARELLLPRAVARSLFEGGVGPGEAAKTYGIHLEVRKLSSQLSHEGVESSGLFGGFGHLELRRVWVEGDGGYEAPIAGLS